MVKVKDISEIYLESKEEHIEKDVYVMIDGVKTPIKWVHHIGDDIILTI